MTTEYEAAINILTRQLKGWGAVVKIEHEEERGLVVFLDPEYVGSDGGVEPPRFVGRFPVRYKAL